MLIDLTRRPVRLIFEECVGLAVIRTMKVTGQADGKIHREALKGDKVKVISKMETLTPKASLPKGDYEFFEFVIPESFLPSNLRTTATPIGRRGGMSAVTIHWEPPPSQEPYFVVTGYDDAITKQRGVWRINLVISPAAAGQKALNVLDETNGLVLFSVQLRPTLTQDALFKVTTPLMRFLREDSDDQEPFMWAELRSEDAEVEWVEDNAF